jgi:hypothetical protein
LRLKICAKNRCPISKAEIRCFEAEKMYFEIGETLI